LVAGAHRGGEGVLESALQAVDTDVAVRVGEVTHGLPPFSAVSVRRPGANNVAEVLGCLGDLVEDVVVHLHEEVHAGSDTRSTVTRRRGGSAANVVESARLAGWPARFIGQVGDDPAGRWLTERLEGVGAEVAVRRAGRTGTIVVLVAADGERTMLADRAACTELADPDPAWLDGLHTLHVPWYSFTSEPLRSSSFVLARLAAERGCRVSIDLSSSALLESATPAAVAADLRSLQPDVVLANEQEAAAMGDWMSTDALGARLVVVKHGSEPAVVSEVGRPEFRVPAVRLATVRDTTGAGDAFAAGFLCALADGAAPAEACAVAHRVAAEAVSRASADGG
ncbi:MAG: hypothetical protein RLZ04_1459, partial [Actinomycetota bacterium]